MSKRDLRQMKLDTYELDDPTRENFEAIEEYVRDDVLPKAGWIFKEITLDKVYTVGTPFKLKHNSRYIPEDIIITSIKMRSGQTTKGTIAVDYDNIDKDFIPLTCDNVAGAVVRLFFGKYSE